MSKIYYDQIPPETGRKYSIAANPDGTSSITDVTQYVQDGTPWGADDANAAMAKATKPLLVSLVIPTTGWAAATAADWQQVTVAVEGLTAGSTIDLQPAEAQLNQLSTDGVSIIRADNVDGVCTIKCKDAVPTVAMTVQATITEVRA